MHEQFEYLILLVDINDEILRIVKEDDEDWDLAYAWNRTYPMN